MKPHSQYALLPLLLTQAWVYADTATPAGQVELEQVQVKGRAVKSFSLSSDDNLRDRANLGLLGRQNTFTSPVTVVNYDEKAFADKEPRNVVDVIAKTDASTMSFGGETNTLNGLYVRNLQIDSRQFSVNGLAGLYSTYNSPTAAVSSAQLIKGASTATVGMDAEGTTGASVNIETKRAADTPVNRVGLSWFGNSRIQPAFDFGRRFGSNNEWGVRINGKYRKGDTPRNGYSEDAREAAVGADYRGERLKAGVDLMYAKRKTEGGRARIQDMQRLNFQMPAAPDGKINLIPSWSGQTTEDKTAMATFEYAAGHGVNYSGGIGYMDSRYDGSFTQLAMRNAAGDYNAAGSRAIDYISRTTSATLKARGEWATGSVNHSWSVAGDYVKRHRDFHQSAQAGAFSSNIYQPVFPNAPVFGSLSNNNTHETFTAPSIAFADTMGMFDNKLRLTLGGRLQYIKQQNHRRGTSTRDHALSPMITAAYLPNPNLVFYGNYMRDLEPGTLVNDDTALNNGDTLAPVKTEQIEVGVRKNWRDGLITSTASLYRIYRPSAYLDPTSRIFGYGGEERNSGLELSTYANLFNKTLRPSLGVSFMRSELRNYKEFNTAAVVNGKQQVTSPRIIAKAGVEWDASFAKGLTLNAYAQHYGKSFQNAANTYVLPSYTTVDVGAKYETKLGRNSRFTLRGAVENVFNKNYWQIQRGRYDRSFAVVGMPRTFWLKADWSF
ncbi:TonB-dependent siderophore receptor [Neisseria sp. 74A18]|uniref:TonB-dependent receptor n=1 Tax=Neisseria sp. 74A18 TaxID=1696094 RepID=UPI0006CAEDEF|nr:TonB-dependent receptor [Neisseria sp. 74A18]